MYMDTRLTDALNLSNAIATISNQRKLAFSKYKENQILFYNGGTFVADLTLLSAVGFMKADTEIEHILVDSNNIPIKISDIEEFYMLVQSKVVESNRQYYHEYESLKRIRTPQAVLDK